MKFRARRWLDKRVSGSLLPPKSVRLLAACYIKFSSFRSDTAHNVFGQNVTSFRALRILDVDVGKIRLTTGSRNFIHGQPTYRSQALEDLGGYKSAENGLRELKLVKEIARCMRKCCEYVVQKDMTGSPSAVIEKIIPYCMTELSDRKCPHEASDVA